MNNACSYIWCQRRMPTLEYSYIHLLQDHQADHGWKWNGASQHPPLSKSIHNILLRDTSSIFEVSQSFRISGALKIYNKKTSKLSGYYKINWLHSNTWICKIMLPLSQWLELYRIFWKMWKTHQQLNSGKNQGVCENRKQELPPQVEAFPAMPDVRTLWCHRCFSSES